MSGLTKKRKREEEMEGEIGNLAAENALLTLCHRDGLNPSSPLFGIFLHEPSSVSLRCRGMIVPQISV